LSSYEFLTNCVRISKPCAFIKIAQNWPAVKTEFKPEFDKSKNKLNDENYKVQYDPVPPNLKEKIIVPQFYDNMADLKGLTYYEGKHFIDKPHFIKQESLVCATKG
jgi:hypothetical protein